MSYTLTTSTTNKNYSCAPSIAKIKGSRKTADSSLSVVANSCLPYESLVLIAQLFNKKHPNDPITIFKTKNAMFRALNERMSKKGCDAHDEVCWIDRSLAFKKQTNRNDDNDDDDRGDEASQLLQNLSNNFKPPKPSSWKRNKNQWLTNVDIAQVVDQYDAANPHFRFMGVFPIDFEKLVEKPSSSSRHRPREKTRTCISQEVCALRLARAKAEGIDQLGFVFNTDPHDRDGQHWIALFVCTNESNPNFGVFFYDSIGAPPPKEIESLVNRLLKECKAMGVDGVDGKDSTQRHTNSKQKKQPVFKYNSIRKQFKNTECGIYAMLFLIRMQNNERFDKVCKSMGNDRAVETFRDILFNDVATTKTTKTTKTTTRRIEMAGKKT
jgi:hypothetical protein